MRARVGPAWLVILAGVCAALHIGKLPPALPVLRDALGVTLVQAGFLLSMVQVAGMTLGLVLGALADNLGGRRAMLMGLMLLSASSALGAAAQSAPALLALRAAEGFGFLLVSLPAPGLLRRYVPPSHLSRMLGFWGAYMPTGTALALLAGPAVIALAGWPAWWLLLAALSAGMTAWLAWGLPPDPARDAPAAASRTDGRGAGRLRRTLSSLGPWLPALGFATYSSQWLAVIGFLPTIYAQAGWAGTVAAFATAAAAAVNMAGNIGAGRLLHRGIPPPRLMQAGYLAMIVGAAIAFAPWTTESGPAVAAARLGGVLLFSAVGGLVPGTLFSLAVRLAPDESTVSTTVGWMQQCSAFGQFAGPPLVAWAAAQAGGWEVAWWVTGAFAACGLAVAWRIGRLLDASTHEVQG